MDPSFSKGDSTVKTKEKKRKLPLKKHKEKEAKIPTKKEKEERNKLK